MTQFVGFCAGEVHRLNGALVQRPDVDVQAPADARDVLHVLWLVRHDRARAGGQDDVRDVVDRDIVRDVVDQRSARLDVREALGQFLFAHSSFLSFFAGNARKKGTHLTACPFGVKLCCFPTLALSKSGFSGSRRCTPPWRCTGTPLSRPPAAPRWYSFYMIARCKATGIRFTDDCLPNDAVS